VVSFTPRPLYPQGKSPWYRHKCIVANFFTLPESHVILVVIRILCDVRKSVFRKIGKVKLELHIT